MWITSGFASSSAIISLAFQSFISSLWHMVFPASFHFLYHPSISICWLISIFLSVCLCISPSLRSGLTNASEVHEKERAPLTLMYCQNAVASTREPAHIPSFPRPPEESFIRFPSLLGKDLGEKSVPNSGGFQRRWSSCRIFCWLLLSNALVLRSMGLPR